jgi:hypothetical protein
VDRNLDVGAFNELIEESQDLHSDAMRAMQEPLDGIVELGRERRASGAFQAEQDERAARIRRSLAGAGLVAGAGALALATASYAQGGDDVAALQTAASLENLAVATYKTALTLPYLQGDAVVLKTVRAFATTTMQQHADHGKAFNAKAKELGGKEQTQPNPKYAPVVTSAVPKLKKGGPLDVVALAITLEDVATSTYVKNVSENVTDPQVRLLFGTVAGVESQHLATLYAVQALLKGGAPQLITVKATGGAVDIAKLPAAAGSVGAPETFKKTDLASPPSEGAVK